MSTTKYRGIVLAGGQSTRMGHEKAILNWNGKPLYKHIQYLLKPFCSEIYISCNENNYDLFKDANCIVDKMEYNNNGPISGLLSCMDSCNGPWIILAVDFANIEKDNIRTLLGAYSDKYLATVYVNASSNITEPLFGIYSINAKIELLNWFKNGNSSLRLFLDSHNTNKIPFFDEKRLLSINSPELYEEMKNKH